MISEELSEALDLPAPVSRPTYDARDTYFLGARFNSGANEDVLQKILSADYRERFKYIAFANVQCMVRFMEDPEIIRPLYERAWQLFCDSRILSGLARLKGLTIPVVTGSDLTARLLERAAERRLSVAIIGPRAADCAVLKEKYPELEIEVHTPPMGFIKSEEEIEKCVDFVVRAQTPLVFLALGMPQQEILARRIADCPQARGIGLCVGASIDFLTGKQKRAPVWVQHLCLEWLHRLLSDPRRLARRYIVESPKIFYLMLLSKNLHSDQISHVSH